MEHISTPSTQVGIVSSYINIPIAVALLFGLVGAVFIGIYIIRRLRARSASKP